MFISAFFIIAKIWKELKWILAGKLKNCSFIHSQWNTMQLLKRMRSFPGGTVVKNPGTNAGDTGSSPGLGRSHMPRSN